MPQWIIVAALLSILATVWLAWLLWRVNVGPQAKRTSHGGDGAPHVFADGGGKSRNDNDTSDTGSDAGGDGGGD